VNHAPPQTAEAAAFRATVLLSGGTATGIEGPGDVVERLRSGRRPRVHVTINDHTYRSSVAPMRGTFMLPVSAEVRTRANVEAGDEVEVALREERT
jgi:hypothetical protein